jgi:hypothetical protein
MFNAALMKPPKHILLIAALTICLFTAPCIFALQSILTRVRILDHCRDRNNTQPHILIVPNSTLLSKETVLDISTMIISQEFQVTLASADVIEFYNARGCIDETSASTGPICEGKLEPFGEYSLWIEKVAPDETIYTLEIQWEKCTSEFTWD